MKPQKTKKRAIIFTAGIVFLIISFFIDKPVFLFSYTVQNPILDYFFTGITQFGHIFVVLVVMSSLFLWEERKREWIPVLWSSFFVSAVLCLFLKVAFMRPRPVDILILSSLAKYSYAFPSLHAAGAFTAIPVLDREFPRLKLFWIVFALLVALSRIYLQAHYLSDVVGGALIGYGTGFLFVFLEEKYRIFKRIGSKK